MSDIQNILKQIRSAVYGKEVREAMYDAIKQCNEEITGIRVDTNGNEYPSAGEAVRGQISKVYDNVGKRFDDINELPNANTADNGKVAKVINGVWSIGNADSLPTVNFAVNTPTGYDSGSYYIFSASDFPVSVDMVIGSYVKDPDGTFYIITEINTAQIKVQQVDYNVPIVRRSTVLPYYNDSFNCNIVSESQLENGIGVVIGDYVKDILGEVWEVTGTASGAVKLTKKVNAIGSDVGIIDIGNNLLNGDSTYYPNPYKIIKDKWEDIPLGMICGTAIYGSFTVYGFKSLNSGIFVMTSGSYLFVIINYNGSWSYSQISSSSSGTF